MSFFIGTAKKLIEDPLRRAVLQHDMWAVFDWLARKSPREQVRARHQLRMRLASVIRRLALSKSEIEKLPDTYTRAADSGGYPTMHDPEHHERAFLPPDLFQPDGPWVCLHDKPVAPRHMDHFSRPTLLASLMGAN